MIPFPFEPIGFPMPGPKPDALFFPQSYPPCGPGEDRHEKLRDEFKSILGDSVATAQYAGGLSFASRHKDNLKLAGGETPVFRNGHPRQGENRFTWFRRDANVFYGFKVPGADDDVGYAPPEPKELDPEAKARIEAAIPPVVSPPITEPTIATSPFQNPA